MTQTIPFCNELSPGMRALLGLPEATQPPVAAIEVVRYNPLTTLPRPIDLGPGVVIGPETPVLFFPPGPIFPPNPGPIIVLPPVRPPVGPPVPPPPQVANVPEPATWAAMLVGLGLVGCLLRRRQRNLGHGS